VLKLCNKKSKGLESGPPLVGPVSDECSGSSGVGDGASAVGLGRWRDTVQTHLQAKKLPVKTKPEQINIKSLIEKNVKTINRKRFYVVVLGFHDSGIVPGSKENDKFAFTSLCGDYLRIAPTVVRCVRLKGSVSSHESQTVRARRYPLLLVTLSSSSEVDDILSRAKLLRNVDDETVSMEVYLSKDFAKDEAKLAFDKRVAKRSKVTSNLTVQSSVLSVRSHSFIPKTQSVVVHPDRQMFTNTVPDAATVLTNSGRPDN